MQTTGARNVNAPTGPTRPTVQETEIGHSSGKPNLLYFYWPIKEDPAGQASRQLDTKIFVDGQVCDLASDFVCIKVNGKACPKQVLRTFGITRFPTVVFEACNQRIVSSVRTVSVSPKVFARTMKAVSATNQRAWRAIQARERALTASLEKGQRLLESGKLSQAEKALRKLIKRYPSSAQANDARAAVTEIGARKNLREGKKLLDAGKYYEARSKLSLAADVEVSCDARDEAEELMPECEYGIKFAEATKLLDAGKNAEAMDALTKILGDDDYEGRFRALAKQKLDELRAAWNKKVG